MGIRREICAAPLVKDGLLVDVLLDPAAAKQADPCGQDQGGRPSPRPPAPAAGLPRIHSSLAA